MRTAALTRQHRAEINKFIVRCIGPLRILYVVLHPDHMWGIWAYVFAVITTAFNSICTEKSFSLGWGRFKVNTQSDVARAGRWILTFAVFNPCYVFVFRSTESELFGILAILTLAAQFEIDSLKMRRGVLIVSMVSYLALLVPMNDGWNEKIIQAIAMLMLIATFLKVEALWVRSLTQTIEIEQQETESRMEIAALTSSAVAGIQAKTVLHEIDNLIQVMSFATNDPDHMMAVIQKSVAQIRQIKGIVLTPGIGSATREVEVGVILDDINVILKKFVRAQGVRWVTEIDKDVIELKITEREGAIYCMILNLLKNSCEAIRFSMIGASGQITLSIQKRPEGVLWKVIDNGPGMSPDKINEVLSGKGTTTKKTGNGIGLRFVIETCQQSGYQLQIQCEDQGGTAFSLLTPAA